MGCGPVCCVALCLLAAGLVDSGVTQTPRYLIKARGQRGTLGCSPVSGHLSVYWYQQALGQGPQFLVQYYSQQVRGEAQLPDRFSGTQFSDFHSELNLTFLELTDSAVYLCASSQDTALHDQPRGPSTCHAPAMNPFLLGCVVFHLLQAGLVDSGVTRTPKYLIKSRKQQVTLRCSSVYWYKQALGQSPQFLVQYYDGEIYQKGNISDRFSGEQFSDSGSELNLTSLELTDSAVYLCASSQDTALHDQLPAVCSPTGLVDSEVTQTPKYLIKSRKEQVTLRCSPKSGHRSVYWYQQALGQGPQSLVQYYSQQGSGEAQLPDRFSGKQFSDFHSELNLTSLELTASAMYLHGSSQDTALHDQGRSMWSWTTWCHSGPQIPGCEKRTEGDNEMYSGSGS
ncbi:hypothetical protein JEQ12_015803 [Ovis aries]|uniref:Ig-like domain-containing protein n=1 Tax=Ovis aries TaxID=9940 RepID=A0A836D2W1_SHEEP|nr:hypothetical protein JEQ12_015803 [Ovis aries]